MYIHMYMCTVYITKYTYVATMYCNPMITTTHITIHTLCTYTHMYIGDNSSATKINSIYICIYSDYDQASKNSACKQNYTYVVIL